MNCWKRVLRFSPQVFKTALRSFRETHCLELNSQTPCASTLIAASASRSCHLRCMPPATSNPLPNTCRAAALPSPNGATSSSPQEAHAPTPGHPASRDFPSTRGGSAPPGKPTATSTMLLDKGAAALQSLRPVKQHVCTFALYAHDPRRQVETHHFMSRLNQDVLQCAVYDSDDKYARLIGVEYIVSRKIFESLPAEEQRLWHLHAHEIEGLWASLRVPGMLEKTELDHMAGTFGKFWCTWQVDRGDRLPLGAPALMMSPQGERVAAVRPDLARKRDQKCGFSTEELKAARADVEVPAEARPGQADYWIRHHKGFAVDVVPHEMKRHAPFPRRLAQRVAELRYS